MRKSERPWLNDSSLPRDPPADASDFGLAMHYGNALLFELMRRHSSPELVMQGLLFYAAIFTASQPTSTEEIVAQFRTTLERVRSGSN